VFDNQAKSFLVIESVGEHRFSIQVTKKSSPFSFAILCIDKKTPSSLLTLQLKAKSEGEF
jgi:hypothetical protein